MADSNTVNILDEIEARLKRTYDITRGQLIQIGGRDMLRTELRGWLLAHGINPKKVAKMQDGTLCNAWKSDTYLDKLRYDIRTGRRDDVYGADRGVDVSKIDIDGDDIDILPPTSTQEYKETVEEAKSDGKTLTLSPDQLAAAADTVLSTRLTQARQQLERVVDDKIAKAVKDVKVSLSEDAKQTIKDMALSAARQAVAEFMPPRRLEIVSLKTSQVHDLGIQHFKFPILLQACQARDQKGNRLNIWLTGPTASGKTSAGEYVAQSLEMEFGADGSLDADYKVIGFKDANGVFHETTFLKIFSKGGIYIADEIDNWLPSALLSLNAALAQGWIFTPNGIYRRHPDCIIIACANTWGLGATNDYVGRTKLDAASLSRFLPKIEWPIDEKMEMAVAREQGGEDWCKIVQKYRARALEQGLKIIISPRDTFNGIALLNTGFSITDVIDMTFAAGLKPEQRTALRIAEEFRTQMAAVS